MNRLFKKNDSIDGLIVIDCDKIEDFRGMNTEGFNKDLYSNIKPFDFKVDSFSYSKNGVLRGFHGDSVNYKLIQCLYGKIQFKAIDIREESPTYKNVFETYLSHEVPTQIFLPIGVVNAHLCLSDNCVFSYKLSHGYTPQSSQVSVKWNYFNLDWDIKNPILSNRDK